MRRMALKSSTSIMVINAYNGITGIGVSTPAAAGVTELLAAEAALVPAEFVAVTVKLYDEPLFKPMTVHDVATGDALLKQVLEESSTAVTV